MPLYLHNNKIQELENKIDKVLKTIDMVEQVVADAE